jgi:hypothetical protein
MLIFQKSDKVIPITNADVNKYVGAIKKFVNLTRVDKHSIVRGLTSSYTRVIVRINFEVSGGMV